MRSYDDEAMADVMRGVGLDPARIPEAARDDIETFIELHIEQGPILEEAGLPVGVVNAITGLGGYIVEVHGRADHAGGFPMDLRRDPMVAAAEIILGVRENAMRDGPPGGDDGRADRGGAELPADRAGARLLQRGRAPPGPGARGTLRAARSALPGSRGTAECRGHMDDTGRHAARDLRRRYRASARDCRAGTGHPDDDDAQRRGA